VCGCLWVSEGTEGRGWPGRSHLRGGAVGAVEQSVTGRHGDTAAYMRPGSLHKTCQTEVSVGG